MNQETDNEKIYKAVEAQRGFLSLCALYIILRGLYTFSEGKPSMTWLSVASYIALAIMLLFISVFTVKNQKDRLMYPNKTSAAFSLISSVSIIGLLLYMFLNATKLMSIAALENAEELGPQIMSGLSLVFYINAVLFLIDSVKVLQGKGYIHMGMVAALASMHLSFAYADILKNMDTAVGFVNKLSISTAVVILESVIAVFFTLLYTKKHEKNA